MSGQDWVVDRSQNSLADILDDFRCNYLSNNIVITIEMAWEGYTVLIFFDNIEAYPSEKLYFTELIIHIFD